MARPRKSNDFINNLIWEYKSMSVPSVRKLGEKYGLSRGCIMRILKQHNVQMKRGGTPKYQNGELSPFDKFIINLQALLDSGQITLRQAEIKYQDYVQKMENQSSSNRNEREILINDAGTILDHLGEASDLYGEHLFYRNGNVKHRIRASSSWGLHDMMIKPGKDSHSYTPEEFLKKHGPHIYNASA